MDDGPPNLDVHIIRIGGTQMAAKIDGTFTLDGTLKLPFEAIAFGRIGGQNVGAKLSESTELGLREAGYDPDEVVMQLQRSLLQGDLTLPEGLSRETFVDDYDYDGDSGDGDRREHNHDTP